MLKFCLAKQQKRKENEQKVVTKNVIEFLLMFLFAFLKRMRTLFLFVTQNAKQPKRLLGWVNDLRKRSGPISRRHYTSIVQKASKEDDLLDIVKDFDQHFGGTPDTIFLSAAAHTATKITTCPASIAAALLQRISSNETVLRGVAISVMNKAANEQDVSSAKKVFGWVAKSSLFDAWTGLLRASQTDKTMACDIVQSIIKDVSCKSSTETGVLGMALKVATNAKRFDLAEKVWKWAAPMRQQQQRDMGLVYTQHVTLCGHAGRVDCVLGCWREWCESNLEIDHELTHNNVFRHAVISALLIAPSENEIMIACEMLELMMDAELSDPPHDSECLPMSLKCAAIANRADLAQRVGNGNANAKMSN